MVVEWARLIQSDAGQLDWCKNRRVADDRRETLSIKRQQPVGTVNRIQAASGVIACKRKVWLSDAFNDLARNPMSVLNRFCTENVRFLCAPNNGVCET